MKTTAPPQFEFVGTIDELVKYVTEVFHDGPRLVVHASVILPMPDQPYLLKKLATYGALPPGLGEWHLKPVFDELLADRKIAAIKELRTLTSWGLRESKDAVELLLLPHVANCLVKATPLTAGVIPGKEFSLEDP